MKVHISHRTKGKAKATTETVNSSLSDGQTRIRFRCGCVDPDSHCINGDTYEELACAVQVGSDAALSASAETPPLPPLMFISGGT